ncbi:CidA-associated membrane protein CidB [Candidatus Burkholderia humilis]|nr:CidA-associated membrane protein CidB [Candidatus Burkholderia humilis]
MKSYRRGVQTVPVLTDITLDIAEGNFVALMGPSGSGKSTLINLIAGIDRPDSGELSVGELDITRLPEAALADWRAANVGFIFQFYNLMPVLSTFENVELPLMLTRLSRHERRERVAMVLDMVNMDDRMDHLSVYFVDTRWLMWLLGPATVAFAVPIYEYRALLKRHWISLTVGVTVSILVAVGGSLALAKLLHLSPELQRSLATRSVSTLFALAVSDKIHAPKDLTALFVIATGVCGMLFGEIVLALVPLRTRLAHGALFGAAAHGLARRRRANSAARKASSPVSR